MSTKPTSMNFKNKVSASVEHHGKAQSGFKLKGRFKLEHWKHGKLVEVQEFDNGVTDGGIENILDVAFVADTQITTWYLGIIDDSGFSALDATDTMASHAGWVELTTYDEATRVAWTPGAAVAKTITNAVTIDFTFNAVKTLKGVFLSSVSTKGDTTGILWATALFSSDIPVGIGSIVKLTYTTQGA